MPYKSPITILQGQINTELEGEVLRAIWKVGVGIDRDELIRALAYDRNQYLKGFNDGYEAGRARRDEEGDTDD